MVTNAEIYNGKTNPIAVMAGDIKRMAEDQIAHFEQKIELLETVIKIDAN